MCVCVYMYFASCDCLVIVLIQEYESNKELYGLQEKYEGAMETVERLEKEKEEMNERHSITLQKLRAELRLQAEKHSQELLQAELEHKVIEYY